MLPRRVRFAHALPFSGRTGQGFRHGRFSAPTRAIIRTAGARSGGRGCHFPGSHASQQRRQAVSGACAGTVGGPGLQGPAGRRTQGVDAAAGALPHLALQRYTARCRRPGPPHATQVGMEAFCQGVRDGAATIVGLGPVEGNAEGGTAGAADEAGRCIGLPGNKRKIMHGWSDSVDTAGMPLPPVIADFPVRPRALSRGSPTGFPYPRSRPPAHHAGTLAPSDCFHRFWSLPNGTARTQYSGHPSL